MEGSRKMPTKIDKPIVIVATSDIHGLLEGIEEVCKNYNADILTISGDIEPADIFVSKPYWFERKFFPLIGKLNCEVVATPGNHDFYLAAQYDAIKRNDKGSIPNNFHLLIDEETTVKGIRIYGTPWVPFIDGRWCFEGMDEDLADKFSLIPEGTDVLLTHSPPYIPHKAIDQSCDYPSEHRRHFGSKSLAKEIQKKWPRVCLCGHIHSGDHDPVAITTQKEGLNFHGTEIFNVSRVNENYTIAYKIRGLIFYPDGSVGDCVKNN